MQLSKALRLKPGFSVAFVGAGGKTSATRRIVDEISGELGDDFKFVLITTTTRIGQSQNDLANYHLIDPSEDQMTALPELLEQHRSVLVTGPDLEGKWIPPKDSVIHGLHQAAAETGALLLIEADGARSRSLKAPDKHEPVIPEFVDLVVPMAGLDILGQTTRSDAIHRPELVSKLLRSRRETQIGPAELAAVLGSENGGLKGIPGGATVRILLNKSIDTAVEAGGQAAEILLNNPRIQSVVIASVREDDPVVEVHSRVAGIILAAGGSSRLGEPKQLVQWRDHPLIWYALRAAEGLDPVSMVIGEAAKELRRSVKRESVTIIENEDWESGQSSSVRIGLEAIPEGAEAVVFLLADMPFVTQELVEALVQRYRQTLAPLVATWAGGRRANPVLFDRETFSDLRQLKGDQGGRAIFRRFEREFVEWDDTVLLDVDTPEDLERLQSME
jgi:molybdenum cofactor cytidylyltransferase